MDTIRFLLSTYTALSRSRIEFDDPADVSTPAFLIPQKTNFTPIPWTAAFDAAWTVTLPGASFRCFCNNVGARALVANVRIRHMIQMASNIDVDAPKIIFYFLCCILRKIQYPLLWQGRRQSPGPRNSWLSLSMGQAILPFPLPRVHSTCDHRFLYLLSTNEGMVEAWPTTSRIFPPILW